MLSALNDLRQIALRDTLELNLVGLASIPVLAFIGPRVVQNDATCTRVRIPLNYRTRNHMGSLYFGVLCAGADVVSGLPVVRLMRERRQFLVPSFKDLHAEFLRRAEGDVEFRCDDVDAITRAFESTVNSGDRVNLPVRSSAYLVDRPDEPVARFTTTLSIRFKPGAKQPWFQQLLAL